LKKLRKNRLLYDLKETKEEIVEENSLKDIIMGSRNCHFKERPTSQVLLIKESQYETIRCWVQ